MDSPTLKAEQQMVAENLDQLGVPSAYETPFEKPVRGWRPEVDATIQISLPGIGADNVPKLQQIERLLHEIGIGFDTGAGGGNRDWEMDRKTQNGPLRIRFRRFRAPLAWDQRLEILFTGNLSHRWNWRLKLEMWWERVRGRAGRAYATHTLN